MIPALFIISVLCIVLITYIAGLKLQLHSLRRQLEYRVDNPVKKPLSLEMQDNDLMALAVALNQIFRQDEEFRSVQRMHENEFKELIANISHDLRTPLTVLKGYLQLLARCGLDDGGREYLSVCFRHADELEQRIRQFFEYAYWMNQDQEPQLKRINVTNLIADTMTGFIPMFEEKGLTMRLNHDAIYRGLADEELLRRVMQNLLKNCLQYSAGEVVVSITEDIAGHISFPQNHIPGDSIRVCVQNPVAGDSVPDCSKIFQRFYVERKERSHATGLGLSIVKLLVEKMQGEVFAVCDDNQLYIGFYLRTSA